jgi:hypothetical protein
MFGKFVMLDGFPSSVTNLPLVKEIKNLNASSKPIRRKVAV